MPSEKPLHRLEDIVENSCAIQRYVAEMTFEDFQKDRKTCDAVERCLERISEAAGKLGDIANTIAPEQPWKAIRAIGNRLRHEYDLIRQDLLWQIVQNDIPALCAACEDALRRLRAG